MSKQHKLEPGLKRGNINDVPVCNDRLITEVALLNKMEKKEVQAMTGFLGTFIRDTMSAGEMKAVMLPYFGKFKPKLRKIQALDKREHQKRNGMENIIRAIKGKPIYDTPKPPPNETL